MNRNKSSASNDLLMLGIGILLIGLILTAYSISTYIEVKNLNEKIDFNSISNNLKLSSNDKYNRYLEISEFLTKKLIQNKNIPLKNSSCVYLDYAQNNAILLYNLTDIKMEGDIAKKSVAAGNIRTLYGLYDNYKTCKQSENYKKELKKYLSDIESGDKNTNSDENLERFLNGDKAKNQYTQGTYPAQEELTDEQLRDLEKEAELLYQNTTPNTGETSTQKFPTDNE